MIHNPVSVQTETDREVVAELTQRYNLFGIPVVSSQGRLLGMVTHESVLETVQAEASEDFATSVGAGAEETVYTDVSRSVRVRLPWLGLNLLLALTVAFVIESQTGLISREPVLAALMPVIALLGTLLALASLNKNSEIIAMRAAGMSRRHLIRAVALPAALLVCGLYTVSEYVSAPLYRQAETQRTVVREGRANLLKGKGLWSASEHRFFNVRTLQHGNVPSGIYLYQFSPDGRLQDFLFAQNAIPAKNREWRLNDVRHKQLKNGQLRTTRSEYRPGGTSLSHRMRRSW